MYHFVFAKHIGSLEFMWHAENSTNTSVIISQRFNSTLCVYLAQGFGVAIKYFISLRQAWGIAVHERSLLEDPQEDLEYIVVWGFCLSFAMPFSKEKMWLWIWSALKVDF